MNKLAFFYFEPFLKNSFSKQNKKQKTKKQNKKYKNCIWTSKKIWKKKNSNSNCKIAKFEIFCSQIKIKTKQFFEKRNKSQREKWV